MQVTLIDQGLDLMLYGMGTVFVFLTVLVFATMLMSRIVSRLPTGGQSQSATAVNSPKNSDGQPSPQIMAAIKLAIAQHRKEHLH